MGNTPNGVRRQASEPRLAGTEIMPRLSHWTLRRLLDCIGKIYLLHDLDTFAGHVMRVGRDAVPADFAVYDEIHIRRRRHRWACDPPGVNLDAPTEAHASFFKEHPFVRCLQRRGDMPPSRLSDFLSRRQYHETAFYHEAYRPRARGCG